MKYVFLIFFLLEVVATASEIPALVNAIGNQPRVGYFTGEFSPFHDGHLSVAETAIEGGNLDLLIVIPTPHASNDPKTDEFSQTEWSERVKMAKVALAGHKKILVWPNDVSDFLETDWKEFSKGKDKPDLGKVLSLIQSKLPKSRKLIHVAGGDSLYRILMRNLTETDPRERIIVTRPGIPIPSAVSDPKNQITVLENKLLSPVSGRLILHFLAADLPPSFVSPEVVKIVTSTPRYRSILKELKEKYKALKTAVSENKEQMNFSDYVVNAHVSYGGMELELPEPPTPELIKTLNSIAKNAQSITVFMKSDETPPEVKSAWEKMARENALGKIVFSNKVSLLKKKKTTQIVHAGVANFMFSTEIFEEQVTKGQNFIVYETDEAPASPLILAAGLKVMKSRKVSIAFRDQCTRMIHDSAD